MNEENNLGVSSINVVESFYQPIKEQQKLYGDQRFNFFKENNVDTAELIGIERDPNVSLLQFKKEDPKAEENNPLFVKDFVNFISDLPDQALYRVMLGGMNGARLGVNLLPMVSRIMGNEPGEQDYEDMNKFAIDLDTKLKTGIENYKRIYSDTFQSVKGRDPNKASDLVSYVAQDYPYAAPVYSVLNKIGVPSIYAIPLSVGISSGIAFDPKTDESSLFFDSSAIKGVREFFNILPDTPESEVFDRAYQTFEGTGLTAAIGPIIQTALFLKRNVPAFNKAIPGGSVAVGGATTIGEITDQTILNPKDETMDNQEPTILDNVKSGIDQFGNKLTEIGGAIKKEFSGEAMANPLIKKGVNELAPVFKSAVVDAIEKIPNKAPGDQILGTLKNIPGVTQQEMKWIGIDDFLKGKPSITKQEVSDFIQANRLDVNEVQFPKKTSTKRTEEEIKTWFENQNADYGEDAYFAYQGIQEALANNGGNRFDDIAYTIGKGKDQYRYNSNDFINNAGLWDEFYENSEIKSFGFFQNELQNTIKVLDITNAKTNELVSKGNFEQLINNWAKESENFRYYHNLDYAGADELRNFLYSQDDFSSLKNYLKENNYKISKFKKINIDDDNLKKIHNEYVIRLNEDTLENRFEIDYRDIQDFIGGTSTTKYSRYTLPGGEDYKELIFTLSKGGKNVGQDFPLQQGATTKQTADNLNLDTSPHMNIKGEFAHVRFKERDIAGQKTLAVEELQSDIFQEVKKENKLIFKVAKEKAAERITRDQEKLGSFENITERDVLQEAKAEIDDKTIKDFPFKNNWYELVTRRLIRYAADNNFSAIAIPEGRVAAARYGKVGGFVDNINVKVDPFYEQPALEEAVKGGYEAIPNYKFTVFYKSGNKEIKEKVFLDDQMYELQKEFPKAFGMFGGDLENVLLHRYTPQELNKQTFNYKFEKPEFSGEGKGKFELYDQAIPAYMKKYAKKWNAPVTTEAVKFREQNESINYVVLKITPEMKRSVQEKSQPLFNIVLPALSAGGGAKVISDSIGNNTISEPTKNQ